MAAIEAWKTYGMAATGPTLVDQYQLRFAFWAGTWRTQSDLMRRLRRDDPDLYVNTRQLWRNADAIVSFYEQLVYAGDLSIDGGPLPDGTKGAIPLDLQTGGKTTDQQLQLSISKLWDVWRYRQMMSIRPKYGAIFGDVLTELVDDLEAGFVFPKIVTPDVVTDIQLNNVGDVQRYTLQWDVPSHEDKAYGGSGKTVEGFTFRKEVDSEAFRYFKNDRPSAIPEWRIPRAVEPNPYGFVPAIWDRHEIVPGPRGMSAIDRTLQQAMEICSILSHALDYQRKQFSAPIGVMGGALPSQRVVNAQPVTPAEIEMQARAMAQTIDLIGMSEGGGFATITADVGKTVEMLDFAMQSLLAEAPESRYGQQILQMTQVTAPGVERALGTVFGRLKRARSNYDPQTVKQHQMAIAMIGFRLAEGDYPARRVSARADRYEPFRSYNLQSYERGLLDFGIADREVIQESLDERIARLAKIENLETEWALRRAGLSEEEVTEILDERKAKEEAMASAVTGFPPA